MMARADDQWQDLGRSGHYSPHGSAAGMTLAPACSSWVPGDGPQMRALRDKRKDGFDENVE
jgi:hypothetical protein